MRIRRVHAVLAVGLMTAVACTGGGDGGTTAGGEVTIDYWALEEDIGPYLEKIEAAFEQANPNINLEVTAFPEQNYDVKLNTALAAGRAPDLIQYPGVDIIRRGLVLPLDDLVAEKGIDLSTFSQAIIREGDEFSCSFGGKLYCLGSYQGASMMLYNKDMFDAAGIPYPEPYPAMTPEEFFDLACRLSDPPNQVWGGAISDPTSFMPWEVFVSPDGRTAEGYVNGPLVVQLYEGLARLFADGCMPSLNLVDPWAQGLDFMASNQLAMVVTDFLNLKKLESAGIDYGATVPPTPVGVEPYFFVWSDSVGVLADSEHPEEAMEFVAFLATEGQRIRFDETGDIPLDSAIAEEVDWANGIPGRLDGLEVLTHARPAIFIPNREGAFGALDDAWGFILSGDKTVQQALDDAAPLVQEDLDEAWRDWESGG